MNKLKFILFLIFFIIYYQCFAQDTNKLVVLTKQIIEAKHNQDVYATFKELMDLYIRENKYNDGVIFLNSLLKQKKTLEPLINYYIGYLRYYQLKYLEETQQWDEYFSQGNSYRDQLTTSLGKAIKSFASSDPFSISSRLLLWRFHQDQQDAFSESALSDLIETTLSYAPTATDIEVLKEVADTVLSYGLKAKAKLIYKIYVDKITTSFTKTEELKNIAYNFYKAANLDLSQTIYDIYIERLISSGPKENVFSPLIEIAKLFAYRDGEPNDPLYAEKIFAKLEGLSTRDIFDEETLYLRAYNLEKAKEYLKAKELYLDLVRRYTQSPHFDEANYKIGLIYTYILRDIEKGKEFFVRLSQKEFLSPQVISSLYQLGLLSQWSQDKPKAKEYYQQLIEKAGNDFLETVVLAKERLKEIEEEKPMEYNLKTFLDISFKEEYAIFDTTRINLRVYPYKTKINQPVNVDATVYTAESGCMQIELEYLWSGHTGTAKPLNTQSSFSTPYLHSGTKEINLVVVSPAAGIIDRSIDIVDVHY